MSAESGAQGERFALLRCGSLRKKMVCDFLEYEGSLTSLKADCGLHGQGYHLLPLV